MTVALFLQGSHPLGTYPTPLLLVLEVHAANLLPPSQYFDLPSLACLPAFPSSTLFSPPRACSHPLCFCPRTDVPSWLHTHRRLAAPLTVNALAPALQYKAAEVGMKLTAGFEMMAADTQCWGQVPDSEADAAPEASGSSQGGNRPAGLT